MFALDLFNTKYEKELKEGAVDSLEARRIDDLNMRMLDLLDRAKESAYKKNPAALAGLKKQFQKIKAERDSYFKINPATGMDPTGSLGTTKGKLDEQHDSPVAGAITRRILMQRSDLLKQYGPELVGAAIDNVADYVGDVEEIGSSDVSGWVNQVERMLKENPPEAFREGSVTKKPQPYNDPNWVKNLPKEKLNALAGPRYKKDKKQQGMAEKLGDLRPKLGSSRDQGKSVRKWRQARGLDESGMAEASNELATMTTMGMGNPLDFSSDYALYTVQKGRELFGTMRNLYTRADALPPAERSKFYKRLDAMAYEGLGDEILRYSKTLTVEDLVAITDVLENYDIMFNTIAIPDELKDAEAAWKQYAAEVALARTQAQPGQTMHERSMAEETKPYGDYPQSPRAFGAGNFQRIVRANMGNLPSVTLEFPKPKDNILLDKNGIDLISDYYDRLNGDSLKNHFIYRVLPSADEVLTVLKKLGWNQAVQPELPGIPTQGELPLQEKKKFDSNSDVTAGDTKVARELQKLRAQYPAAKSDVEAVAKAEIDSTDRSQQQLSAIKGANTEQDRLLKQLVALDKKQGTEIGSLDNENDRLEQQLAQVEKTNANLAQAIDQMGGPAQDSNTDTGQPGTINLLPNAPADAPSQTQAQPTAAATAEPEPEQKFKSKSNAMSQMAQNLSQPIKVQGVNRGPAPSIRGATDLDQYRADAVKRAQAAIADKNFAPLANQLVNKGVVTRTGTDEAVNEEQRLQQGDPVVVTAPNEFEGKTGEIHELSPSGKFVIVNLYNHGKHSMHLSDVAYNDHADQEEANDWYDEGVAEGKKKKKSSRSMGGYFFPGYAYYGGDSGDGGGDGGGESINHRVAETALNSKDPQGDYEAKRKALQDLGMNKAVDQAAVLQRRLDLDREAKAKGVTKGSLNEFAPAGGGGSGDYFQALASAWYNGAFDTGSLQKGIKSKEDVERLLNRGIVAPDGKIRKYAIDYNSNFDGVVISSDDYYEHADYNDQGQEVDSRTGQKWGPNDYMEFGDEELDESAQWRDPKYKGQVYTQEPPDYNDTREYDNARFNPKPKGYPGRKELPGGGEYNRTDPLRRGQGIGRSGIKNNINLSGKRKGLPSRDQITSLKGSIKDAHGTHTRPNLPEQGVAEGYTDDDIETTRQFRKAIAGLKARSAIDKAKDGAGAKYYYDGAKVTPQETARRAAERKAQKDKKGMAEGLNEFAPDGFNGGDDGEEFNPRLAKMAYDEGVVKGVSLADGATLERAMTINDWDKHDGGIYKQHFAKGFKAGRMNKIRHDNKQYNLNLKLMKDGSIRHGEQGVAEGGRRYDDNRTGFGKRPREDDEYHVADPVETQYNIKVNGQAINRQPFANRAVAVAWAKQAVAAGKLDPKTATLSPINQVNELSTEKLAQYKTAAALDAGAADKRGDYGRGDKRFSGIVKATKKQFANDAKKHKDQDVAEATGDKPFDKMMTTIKQGTNKQKTADRKEQQKQTQQRARDTFGNMFGGGNPADKLSIRKGMAEGLLKEPATRKEYLDQRDKLFRMMAVDSNPANKQIIKQALKDLEARYGNLKNTVKEESSTASEAVERAILNRIMVAHTDLLMKFGPDKVMQAAEEVAYNVGDLDEIGTSDVSAYVNQVRQILGA